MTNTYPCTIYRWHLGGKNVSYVNEKNEISLWRQAIDVHKSIAANNEYTASICFLGGNDFYGTEGSRYDDILQYHEESEQWRLAGRMRHAREYHAVATLSLQDVREHCLGLELDNI